MKEIERTKIIGKFELCPRRMIIKSCRVREKNFQKIFVVLLLLIIFPKLWAFPTSILGFVIGVLGAPFSHGRIYFHQNALVFTGQYWIPPKDLGAITIGNVILITGDKLNYYGMWHEQRHTKQGEFLGPFYIPAHILCQSYSFLKTGTYNQANPLENF